MSTRKIKSRVARVSSRAPSHLAFGLAKKYERFADTWVAFERRATKNFSPTQKKMWGMLVFLLRFTALAAPLHFLIWLNFDATAVQLVTARATAWLLSLFPVEFSRQGILFLVTTPSGLLGVEIVKDCVGWKAALALFGLVFAVRGVVIRQRLLALVFGLPVIFAGNVVRLATTMALPAIYGLEIFDVIHSFLWQWGLVLLILAVWAIWLVRLPQRPTSSP